ncbi:MAG: hypothetical protein ACQETB_01485 [Halobacteriota archaeon]
MRLPSDRPAGSDRRVSGLSRRRVLATIGGTIAAPIAGCADLADQPPFFRETPTPTPTEPTPEEPCVIDPIESEQIGSDPGFPESIVRSEPLETSDFAVQARMTRGFTTDRPALLVIRYTNKRSTEHEFAGGPTPPYSTYQGAHTDLEDVGLLAVPDIERHIDVAFPRAPDDGCWRAESELEVDPVETVTTVGPCESITRMYRLYATASSQQCLAPGTYAFEPRSFGDDDTWALSVELLVSEE